MRVNFTSFNTESGYDYVYVFDGYDAHAPILGVYSGSGALSGVVKGTSSNPSGCLSFRFVSDGATVTSGWQATVTCVNNPSAVVPTSNSEDCQGAIVVCSDATAHGGTNNYGFQELPYQWNSCLGYGTDEGEYESNWYVFSPATNGTVGFEILPTSAADYDWSIWGPYDALECPAFTNDTPIRCSSTSLAGSGPNGATGLKVPATDVIEQNGEYGGGSNENGYLMPLNVLAGEVYVMMLDNWSANTTDFTLNWTLTNGATLDCAPVLPINLVNFGASCDENNTVLKWITESENNNDYFVIEKSDENFDFYEIGRVQGSGNSNVMLEYNFRDESFNSKTSYYRLKQVDFDGSEHYHRIVASNCQNNDFQVSNINLTSSQLDLIISSSTNEKVVVFLYENTGKLIAQKELELNSGNNKFCLNSFNINSGIYFINVLGKEKKYSTKIFRE